MAVSEKGVAHVSNAAGEGAGNDIMSASVPHDGRRGTSCAGPATVLTGPQEHQRAWEAFGTGTVQMIPLLKAHLAAVTQETERAALELMMHLRVLASPNGEATAKDRSASLSQVVMAMQFQDITRQKLEHVGSALDQLNKHVQALLNGPLNEEAQKEIAAFQLLEQNYTMEAERQLHQTILGPDYGEPVPMGVPEEGPDAVTLF